MAMSNGYAKTTTVIFNLSALFSGLKQEKPERTTYVDEVLSFIQDAGLRLIVCSAENSNTELLKAFDIARYFMWEEQPQLIMPSRETVRAQELALDPLTYYEALQQLDNIDDVENLATVATDHTQIKISRASGIRKVIGFYGSPDIPLGQLHTHKQSLQRDMSPLAGTQLTTSSLRAIPEYLRLHV